jgi:hypothetical protein
VYDNFLSGIVIEGSVSLEKESQHDDTESGVLSSEESADEEQEAALEEDDFKKKSYVNPLPSQSDTEVRKLIGEELSDYSLSAVLHRVRGNEKLRRCLLLYEVCLQLDVTEEGYKNLVELPAFSDSVDRTIHPPNDFRKLKRIIEREVFSSQQEFYGFKKMTATVSPSLVMTLRIAPT